MSCYCWSLGPLSLRSGDMCGFCESQVPVPCSTTVPGPTFTRADLDPNTPYEERERVTKERMASVDLWQKLSFHNCQFCGKAAAYCHPKNGYVCSSCPRFG